MVTEYSVTGRFWLSAVGYRLSARRQQASSRRFSEAESREPKAFLVVPLRQIQHDAAAGEVGEAGRDGAGGEGVEQIAIDRHFRRQVAAAGAVLLLVVVVGESKAEAGLAAFGFDGVQRVQPELAGG